MRRSATNLAIPAGFLAVVLLVTNVATANQDAAAIEAFSRISEIRHVAISPSGQRIAYQRIENDSNLILVFDVATGELVFNMGVDDSDISSIRFVGETTLMFVYDRRHHFADTGQRRARMIRFLNLVSGDIDYLDLRRQRTDVPLNRTRGDVVGISEDYNSLYITMREGRAEFNSLFEYSIEHGANNRPLARGSSDTIDWFLGDNGRPVARIDFDEDDDLYTIFVYRNDEPEVLFQERVASPQMRVVALTPERDGLVYTTQLPGSQEMTLHVLSLEDASRSAPIFKFGSGGLLVDSGRRAIALQKVASEADEYEALSQKVESRFQSIRDSIPGTKVRLKSFTDDFDSVVVRLYRNWGEAHYLLFPSNAAKPTLIAKEETGAPTGDIRTDYNYKIIASDGQPVRTRLTRKADIAAKGRAPLVVLSEAPVWLEQYFASRGYVVVQPVPRHNQYRRWFIPESAATMAGRMHTDLNDTVAHLVDKGMVDPERVCVVGVFMGGYAAALAASASPGTYRCVATVNGFFKLDRMARRVREGVKDDSARVRLFEARYGVDASDKDSLKAASPISHVDSDSAPLLLVYFKKADKLIGDQAKEYGQALKRIDREYRIEGLNTDDVFFDHSETRRQVLTALSDFVDEHLQGAPFR